jgi:hypothetical protein
MHTGSGQVAELYLDGSFKLNCRPALVPAPGRYLLAHESVSNSPLADAIFFYEAYPQGFRAEAQRSSEWRVGTQLGLRGPLGRGFSPPAAVRRIALLLPDRTRLGLRGLLSSALKRRMEVALLAEAGVNDLPEAVEVLPEAAIGEILNWADFIAAILLPESLDRLAGLIRGSAKMKSLPEGQVLIHTPVPCGGLAECGACAVKLQSGWKLACKDGPVFDLGKVLPRLSPA